MLGWLLCCAASQHSLPCCYILLFANATISVLFCVLQILAVNSTPIVNLPHLAQIVTSCTSDYLCFDCDYNETIVINRQQAAAGTHTGKHTCLRLCGRLCECW